MQTIAQGLLVLKLTNSGTMLGIIIALQFLPILLFGPIGGVIADRFPKRKILYCTQSAAGALAVILGILVWTQLVQVWMVGVLAFCLGLVNMVDNPTRQTFLPEMVGKETLFNAVTINSWEVNLTRLIGPSLAGIVAATIGLTACFLLNGISYIAVLIVLSLMTTEDLFPAPRSKKVSGQLKEGLAYIRGNSVLRNTLVMLALVGTFTYEFPVILPLLAEFTFHNLKFGYAALTAAMGFGAVVGGLFVASRKKNSPRQLIVATSIFSIAMFLVAISPTLPVAIIAMMLVGAASINFTSLGNITLQLESLPEMRGRVMSFWTIGFLGTTPIGGPIIGWIGEHIGPRWGLGVGGLAALIAAVLGMLTLTSIKLQNIPKQVEARDKTTEIRQSARV